MLDIIIGVAVIVLCLSASTALLLYSRREIERISRLKRSTYRDIMQSRNA